MITIEKGVPLPAAQEFITKSRYPWDLMEVGDSFLVPTEEGKTPRQLMQKISPSVSRRASRTGTKYTLRIVEGGVRVWRLADENTVSGFVAPPPPATEFKTGE